MEDANTGDLAGHLRVRLSYLPPTYAGLDKARAAWGKNANGRFRVMKEHNGIIFTRLGRQIDVVSRCPWLAFQNNDRYWNVEVDFPATLDEEFAITTSKQRVEVSDRIWAALEQAGVRKAVEQLRRLDKEGRAMFEAQLDSRTDRRLSEFALCAEQTTRRSRYRVLTESLPGEAFFGRPPGCWRPAATRGPRRCPTRRPCSPCGYTRSSGGSRASWLA